MPPTKVHVDQTYPAKRKNAEIALEAILNQGKSYLFHYKWLIAFIYGEEENTCIDLFGYSGLKKGVWPGNPHVRGWHYRNGIYSNTGGDFTTTDGLIVLGEEEKLRRNRPDLATYIETTLHPFDLHTKNR